MILISARNVNDAWVQGYELLEKEGIPEKSRNGEVLVAPYPVTTCYEEPRERVLFDPGRDCNPYFHLMEALWMLVGRRDVEFVARYNKRMKDYSDDGKIFHAAYGYRWRHHWKIDQIQSVIRILAQDQTSRRAYISMWDPDSDLEKSGKDFPCNVGISFQIHEGRLNMIVFNRSNDIVWGNMGLMLFICQFFKNIFRLLLA